MKLSELKQTIKQFKNNNIDYKEYYKHILLNNCQYWNFVNPNKCKPSFNNNPSNYLKFMILKKLIKEGYKLKPFKVNKYRYDYFLKKS